MSRNLLTMAALGAVLALGACGDDNGPNGDSLNEQEQTALIQALTTEHAITDPGLIIAYGPLLGEAEVGTMGSYSAIASQVKFTAVTDEGTTFATTTGVTGWTGLDADARTVASALSVFSLTNDGAIPTTVNAAIPDDAQAFYFLANGDSHYAPGNSGRFVVSSSSFGAYQDCPNVPTNLPAGVSVTDCRFATGTMAGNFDFTADRVDGTGAESFTQSNLSYSLPAVQLLLTVDYTGVTASRTAK